MRLERTNSANYYRLTEFHSAVQVINKGLADKVPLVNNFDLMRRLLPEDETPGVVRFTFGKHTVMDMWCDVVINKIVSLNSFMIALDIVYNPPPEGRNNATMSVYYNALRIDNDKMLKMPKVW